MEAAYEAAIQRFETLGSDTHLPFLEIALYRKYFIEVKTEERLRCLETVCASLERHRHSTLKLLKLVHEREGVMQSIFQSAEEFSHGEISTLEVQTRVLQLLYAHQNVTLQCVEGLLEWREMLTRPYPFKWQGENYLLKILHDCEMLDESTLRKVLPLRVSQFPLCSNITSLNLFATQSVGKAKPQSEPAKVDRMKRLRAGEAVLADEATLQKDVLRELEAIANTGRFVPLLNLPNLVPECLTGIRISRSEWSEQHRKVIASAATEMEEGKDKEDSPTPASTPRSRSASASSRHSE